MKKYELIENKENILATLENDTLKRNGKLLNLIKILNLLSENFILSIDGSWGCGKTFFVKQLEYVLNSDMNLPLIDKNSSEILSEFRDRHVLFYYNAWENDDHGSPLGSLIFSILNDYPKYKDCVIDNKNIFTTIKPILKNIISKSTGNILSPEVFDRLTTFEELAEEVITVEEKKTAINKLFNNIIPNNKRLILVIDELDRCRPDFAVKMLETIKHFYFNPKITVIVVTNNKELSNTVKKFYGEGFDGYRYLNKIYETVITLETENLKEYIDYYCEFKKETFLPEDISYLLFQHYLFTYRDCNKFITMYRIIEKFINRESYFEKEEQSVTKYILVPIALALKVKNVSKYNDYISGNGEQVISEFFDYIEGYDDNGINYMEWLMEMLKVEDKSKAKEEFIKMYKNGIKNSKLVRGFPFLDIISMLGNTLNQY